MYSEPESPVRSLMFSEFPEYCRKYGPEALEAHLLDAACRHVLRSLPVCGRPTVYMTAQTRMVARGGR